MSVGAALAACEDRPMRLPLLLSVLVAALLAFVPPASAADGDDAGLGQRCVVHLSVSGAEIHRRAQRHGNGNEWFREPAWRVRPGGSTMWETRGRRGRGCEASVTYDGPGDQRFVIWLVNPVRGAATRRCTARGTGTFDCTVRKRPRTARTVAIDVAIRFGR